MTIDLVAKLDVQWGGFCERLEGLPDHEYLWEPVPDCWNVRPATDGAWAIDFYSDGDASVWPPPLTTIAWRICHLGLSFAVHAQRLFGLTSPQAAPASWPATAEDGMRYVEAAYTTWRTGVAALTDAEREAEPMALGQVMHLGGHGSEIALLRDLYWEHHKNDPVVAALIHGDEVSVQEAGRDAVDRTRDRHPDLMVVAARTGGFPVVRVLVELGFSVNPKGRRAPLHEAVQRNDADLVRYLVEHGADVGPVDSVFHATPLGWAEFYGHAEIASYLSSLG